MDIVASLALRLARWWLRLFGLELAAQPVARDRRGRFTAARVGAGPPDRGGYPADLSDLAAALLDHLGVSPKMYKEATGLTLPDDIEDTAAFALSLRHWVAHNMERWVEGKNRSPGVVFSVLERTFALDRLKFARNAAHARENAPTVRSAVKGNTYTAYYYPPVQAAASQDGARAFCPPAVQPPAPPATEPPVPPSLDTPNVRPDDSVAEGNSQPELTAGRMPALRGMEPVSVPKYDPHLDIAGKLPKAIRNQRCPGGYLRGFGNDPQQARESYEARNRADLGSAYGTFALPCKVYEAFDDKQQRYYFAQADGSREQTPNDDLRMTNEVEGETHVRHSSFDIRRSEDYIHLLDAP